MRVRTRYLAALAAAAWLAGSPAVAQDSTAEDRDALTGFLEDSLSAAGRTVTIDGFAGALSSRATARSISIADATGVWLRLDGLTLDWSRSALFSGRVEISELSAERIEVLRRPTTASTAVADPEAPDFSLPDLPVSVDIGMLRASEIVLAPSVLGQAVRGSLDASLTLDDGAGTADLSLLRRDDGPEGRIVLAAAFDNASRQLSVDLTAAEGAGGIVAGLAGLPGAPALELTVTGAGPLDDFTADIAASSGGVQRASGLVVLSGVDDDGGIGFAADLETDLAELVPEAYRPFFGSAQTLDLAGASAASGAFRLDRLSLTTEALQVSGALALAADGSPRRADLSGRLGLADGRPVILPIPGGPTTVRSASLRLSFDADAGSGWTMEARSEDLSAPGFAIARFGLSAAGEIGQDAGAAPFDGRVTYSADGLRPADPALAAALGDNLAGSADLRIDPGGDTLDIRSMTLRGAGLDLALAGSLDGLDTGLRFTGRLDATLGDLARLSGLAGRPLTGAGRVTAEGSVTPLARQFDLRGNITATGLATGTALDPLFGPTTEVEIDARRDAAGVLIRQAELRADTASATMSGLLASRASDLAAAIRIDDVGRLRPGGGGALTVTARYQGALDDGRLTLDGTGRDLRFGLGDADRLLAGDSRVSARLGWVDGDLTIEEGSLQTPRARLRTAGRLTAGARALQIDGRIDDASALVPGFPGVLTLTGSVTDRGSGLLLDLDVTGPGGIDTAVTGRVDPVARQGDLRIAGRAQAALANGRLDPRAVSGPLSFDLRLAGPLSLASLSGDVRLTGGTLSDLGAGLALRDINATARLSGGRAAVTMTGAATRGGRVGAEGTVGLAAPFPLDLAITLDGARLRDPQLYRAEVDGGLRLTGSVRAARLAGALTLGDAEIRIPSSDLSALGALPDIRHVGAPAPVWTTLRRVGGEGGAATAARGGSAAPIALDITLDAPGRIFVRGRGLDAEFRGRLRVGGTTADIQPGGAFSLIRGRLDILGRRLVLTRAELSLAGELTPILDIVAATATDDGEVRVEIVGPATDPDVRFASSPDLPQEEILARLLFGRALSTLSPFQVAQLANAVATLAGRGGVGVIGRLRSSFGLDDLDVTTEAEGGLVLRAGKYVADNVYSEIEVDEEGRSKVKLNLDLRPGVTVTGTVGSDGETGLGIFVEKDY